MNINYPEFSWSLSRHKTLSECARRYYFSYYASPIGRRRNASNFQKHAWRLKNLQSLAMVFGSSVHEQIHRIVNSLDGLKELPLQLEIMANIRSDLNKSYCDSKYRQNLWLEMPSDYSILSEIYFDGELSLEAISDYQQRLPDIVHNLISCNTVNDLFQRRKDTKLIASERFRFIEVRGVKVWIVMDLLYRDLGNGKYVITDFKTGKRSENDRTQLALYAKFVKESFQIGTEDQIELRNEYLNDGSFVSFAPTRYDFENIDYLIHTSIDWMQSYLQDIQNNVPFEMEAFEQTKYEPTCRSCQFRELCGKAA